MASHTVVFQCSSPQRGEAPPKHGHTVLDYSLKRGEDEEDMDEPKATVRLALQRTKHRVVVIGGGDGDDEEKDNAGV